MFNEFWWVVVESSTVLLMKDRNTTLKQRDICNVKCKRLEDFFNIIVTFET